MLLQEVNMHDHLKQSFKKETRYFHPDVWTAVNFAATAHEKQIRKITGNNYIEHPLGVLELVRLITDDIATQQAAVLHDTIEDTTVTYEDLEFYFDKDVARIVWGVSKNKAKDWYGANEAYLERLRNRAPEESVIVSVADKIHNLTDMIESFRQIDDSMWKFFKAEPMDHLWWYTSVLGVGKERIPDSPLVHILDDRIKTFKHEVLGRSARFAVDVLAS